MALTKEGETERLTPPLPPGEKLDTGLPICMLDVISDVRTIGDGIIVPTLPAVIAAMPKPDTLE
jgi:hypothetical protein